MRQITQDFDAADGLQLEEINGRTVFLAHQRHQHVHRMHFAFFHRLRVNNRPLHHTLETECRLGFHLVHQIGRQRGRVVLNAADQLAGQDIQVHMQGFQHLLNIVRLLHQCQQELFQSNQLETAGAGIGIKFLQNPFHRIRNHETSSKIHFNGNPASSARWCTCICLVCAMSRV